MMNTYYFYKIINDIDNDIYIGSTVDPTRRWSKHKQDTTRGTTITPKIRELGIEHFSFHIIEFGEYTIRQDALEREDELISEHSAMNKCCASSKQGIINRKASIAKYESKPETKIKKAKYKKEYKEQNREKILDQAAEYNNRPEVKERKLEWQRKNRLANPTIKIAKVYYGTNQEKKAFYAYVKREFVNFSTRKQFSVSVFQ